MTAGPTPGRAQSREPRCLACSCGRSVSEAGTTVPPLSACHSRACSSVMRKVSRRLRSCPPRLRSTTSQRRRVLPVALSLLMLILDTMRGAVPTHVVSGADGPGPVLIGTDE